MSQQSAAPAQTTAAQQNDDAAVSSGKISYAEHKEQQKKIRRVEKLIKESETKIEAMENRISEIDALLCPPETAAAMSGINEYTGLKARMADAGQGSAKNSKRSNNSAHTQLISANAT